MCLKIEIRKKKINLFSFRIRLINSLIELGKTSIETKQNF